MNELTHARLALALRAAVSAALQDAPTFDPPPNIDLAVAAFPRKGPPVWANVLFSREHPRGLVADISAHAGPVANVRFYADPVDNARNSLAWQPRADWRRLPLHPLFGVGPYRFIAPYPASLLKLMVVVGVARLVDAHQAEWDEVWPHANQPRTVAQWAEAMITVSSNDATDAMVALLHARGLIHRSGSQEHHNALHGLFAHEGLHTLRLANTLPSGGWRNSDGAGVGHLQMTAWDTVRLLWRMSPDAPHAPWREAHAKPLISTASAQRIWDWMGDQALHAVLSSTMLAGVPGWQRGIPARLPTRWLQSDGSVLIEGDRAPADVRPAQAAATARFAHKTGTTENYCSNAGRVRGDGGRDYLIAIQTTLGARHAPRPECATDWCIPRIGATVDAWLKERLE